MAETVNDPYQETQNTTAEDPQEDVGPEKADSFQTAFEERLREVEGQKVAPATKKAAKKITEKETPEEPPKETSEEDPEKDEEESTEVNFESLFEDVYGTVYDALKEGDEDKMSAIKNMLKEDATLQEMASKNPEQFAIYFYRQS